MPPIKGQRQQRGQIRRQAILDAAIELMGSKGFRGTGLAALSKKIGLSESGILHYFGSKDGLLIAVLEERDRHGASMVDQVIEAAGAEFIQQFPCMADGIVAAPGLARLHLMLAVEHLDDHGLARGYFMRRAQDARARIAQSLSLGIGAGEIRSDIDPQAKAVEILAFLEGVNLHWLLDPNGLDLREAYRAYAQSLIQDFAPA